MEGQNAAAHTAQEGYLLSMHDGIEPTYFSTKVGRDQASPNGGWTSDKGKGLAFARSIDALNFVKTFMPHMEGTCQISLHYLGRAA